MKRLGLSLLLAATCLQLPAIALAEAANSDGLSGLALAQNKSCLNCHAVDRKLLGPSYKDVATQYKTDPSAAARLAQKVIAGGGGVWGTAKMPSNPQVSEAEARKLMAWILSQK